MNTLQRTTTRKSLPLTARDDRDLAVLRGSKVHREALSRLADTTVDASASEAAYLHPVFEAGLQAIKEQVEESGYAEMAAQRNAEGETIEARRAAARRRRPSWADE